MDFHDSGNLRPAATLREAAPREWIIPGIAQPYSVRRFGHACSFSPWRFGSWPADVLLGLVGAGRLHVPERLRPAADDDSDQPARGLGLDTSTGLYLYAQQLFPAILDNKIMRYRLALRDFSGIEHRVFNKQSRITAGRNTH